MPVTKNSKVKESTSKKKAVKKTARKAVKKTTLRKKEVKPKKKVTNKSAKTKTSSKKSVTEKPVSKKKIKEKTKVEETVSLPSGMSIKAVNKSINLKKELSEYINRSVYIVAYVSAICFIIVGSFAAFSEIFTENQHLSTQKAELISASTTSQLVPEVDILSDIPSNITGEYKMNFSARNVGSVKAYLRSNETGLSSQLDLEPMLDEKYRVRFSPTFEPGYYVVKIAYTPIGSLQLSGLVSRTFFIGSAETEYLYNNPQPPQEVLNIEDEHEDEIETDLQDEYKNTTTEEPDNDVDKPPLKIAEPVIREVSDFKNKPTTTEEVVVEPATSEDTNSHTETDEFEKLPIIEITSNNKVLSGPSVFSVSTNAEISFLELYARPLNSLQKKFIGLATKRSTGWVFPINSNNIPNGDYEFTARTRSNGKNVDSNSLRITVKNSSTIPEAVSEVAQDVDSNSSLNEEVPKPDKPLRPFVDTVTGEFESAISIESDIERKTNQLLNENSSDLDALFRRYAVALQSGDPVLIATAEADLNKRREAIVLKTLQDETTKDISDNIDEDIRNKFESIQEKVRTFEEIRKEKTNGNTAKDSDGDGISDFDELNLYQTDPSSPDTDNDGINDGIEIIKGFNPRDEKPEALIVFESPKDVKNLQRDDVLKVESVVPLVESKSNNDAKAPVRTEIKGTALPNSFVTLYIFSTPTVVTVKTDDNGAFVYTFDKELDDGLHEVYVAVTDNTGSIIAQSNPFSFVKEAQAFTPVDFEPVPLTETNLPASQSGTPYNLVIGLAVLSLGVILLMLGIGLRTKEQEFAVVTTEDNNDDQIVITDNSFKEEKG